jgi:hypothetical protein
VAFSDGTTQIGTGTLSPNAQATFSTSSLSAGIHSITAKYSGDTNFAASTSAAFTETINAALDFAIGVATGGSASATVKAGQTAAYALQVSLVGGAATNQLTVTVSCTGAPSKATCTGPASAVTVTQAGPVAVAINVSTTANGMLIPAPPPSRLRTPLDHLPILYVLLLLLLLLWLRRRKQTEARMWAARLAFAAPVLLLAMTIASIGGCSGGGTTSPPPPVNIGTPPGTYTLTVTAASGDLTHTQQLTLTVQ